MHWEASALTDPGRVRPNNEDAFLLRPEQGLFAIADGMGGHAAGEVASEIALHVLEHEITAASATAPEIEPLLARAVHTANRTIYERAAREPELAGMGTTLTALILLPGTSSFHIAHVGDSRAYLLSRTRLRRLTTDHTWVQEQIDRGTLTAAEAHRHPLASILTRALGTARTVQVDLLHGSPAPHDLFLLASDGLTSMLSDHDIHALLDPALPLDQLARRLVDAANLRGGFDNITVVLVRVTA